MKVYVVATNKDFTAICKAENKEAAVNIAKGYHAAKYGSSANLGFEAYEADEYFEEGDCTEICFYYD